MNLKEYLTDLYKDSQCINLKRIKDKNVISQLNEKYNNIPLLEAVYLEMNGIDRQSLKCEKGNYPKFLSSRKGYTKYCKPTCSCVRNMLSHAVKESQSKVTPEERKKRQNKQKQTCLERYGNEYAIASEEVQEKIKQTNMERYGVNSTLELKEVQEKIKQTNTERYGNEYAIASEEIKDKKHQTNLDKYGVKNPLESKKIRQKGRNTCKKRYGMEVPLQCPNIIEKRVKSRNKNKAIQLIEKLEDIVTPLFDSVEYTGAQKRYPWKCKKCDNEFEDHVYNTRIPRCPTCYPPNSSNFEREVAGHIEQYYSIERNNRNVVGKELDIFIPDLSLAIECNGLYWHSELNGKDKHYHLNKTISCQEKDIHLIHIWEDQWHNKQDIVLSRINSLLGINDKIPARKCKISEINSSEFINENHLQGNCPSTIKYGLIHDNEIVAAMTFGKPRFNKRYEWELLRYCTKKNTNIIGGSSRLFKHFINQTKPNSVISYANREWSNGDMYNTLGFQFKEYTKPNYWYIINGIRYSRVKFQKHKLEKLLEFYNPNLTEWENMIMNEYDRIWDCGNSVWTWNNT